MATTLAVFSRRLLMLSLAVSLLVCGQGGAWAASDQDTARINRIFVALVGSGVVQPIDAAIWEANAIDCVNKKLTDPLSCSLRQVPTVLQPAIVAYGSAQRSIQGTWFTRAIYPGQGAAEGSLIVDNQNVGTLTSGSSSSTLSFSSYDDPDGMKYIVFAYRTSGGDRGSGALQLSADGCLLYGGYHSADDPKTIGNFVGARC